MNVLIIGANGKIGTILSKKLKSTPHQPVAMVREEVQQRSFKDKDIDTVLADLEKNFDHAFDGVDAVVFTSRQWGTYREGQDPSGRPLRG